MLTTTESSSSPLQRSTTNTPQQHNIHFYSNSNGEDQHHQKSFSNSLVSNHSQLSYLNNNGHVGGGVKRSTPRLYTPTNYSGGGGAQRNRSQTQSPSTISSGDGASNRVIMDNGLMVTMPPSGHLSLDHHHVLHCVGDDNMMMMMNSSGSHSITPPNSNSNTTISCGSGNSTSANIGVPHTTPKSTLNHNNNNHIQRQTDLENLRNNRTSPRPKAKKCILEEDDENNVEKCVQKSGARSWVVPNQEFLPICDAMFNIISLAAYFCDIVFDVLTAYTWYRMSQDETDDLLLLDPQEAADHQSKSRAMCQWSLVALSFITLAALLSQGLSFKWYKESVKRGQIGPDGMDLEGPPTQCSTGALVVMHVSLCGVLWRYFKLFIPVDLRFVKNEVRDLCLLRLVHAFCEAVPMLLIQLYLIWGSSGPQEVSDFTIVSTSLSLFSVCWALASFSKNIRKQNVHKLVLTWLGVIFQFFWHLGTIISRVVALSLYASVYQFWIFLVLALHWICMLLWLISPKNLYNGEKISTFRKMLYSTLLAVVYTFCYVNVQESNSRQTVIIYYVTMILENTLLLSVWLIAKRYEDEIWYKNQVISAVFLCFGGGILFMVLYYRYFHLKRLSYVYDTESSIYRSSSVLNGGSSVNISGAIYPPSSLKGKQRREPSTATELPNQNSNKNIANNINSPKELNGGTINGLGMIISNGGPNSHHQNNSDNNIIGTSAKEKKTPERYHKRNGSTHHDKGLKSDKSSVGGARGGVYNKINGHHIHHQNVPAGVFNCRFHPAMKRKKKKPSSFVPPPAVQQAASPTNNNNNRTCPDDDEEEDETFSNRRGQRTSPSSQTPQQLRSTPCSGSGSGRRTSHQSDFHDFGGLMDTTERHLNSSGLTSNNNNKLPIVFPGGRMSHPFWKRPLSVAMGSENEGSVGSRVDIQQKLQEKKQQQLAELKEIQEEIKQGKLKRPQFNEIPQPVKPQVCQPIPVEKKKPINQPWFRTHNQQQDDSVMGDPPPFIIYPRPPFMVPTNGTATNSDPNANEVILDPQYLVYASPTLEGSECGYYENPDWPIHTYEEPEPMYQNDDLQSSGGGCGAGIQRRRRNAKNRISKESIYKSVRMHSDIDSQMSLPRSYTLPREFKYKRKYRKPIKNEQFLPSTNSSDGDVDSGEDDPEIYGSLGPLPLPSIHHVVLNGSSDIMPIITNSSSAPQPSKKSHPVSRRQNKLHETKL